MVKRRMRLDTRRITALDGGITQRFWSAEKHPGPVLTDPLPGVASSRYYAVTHREGEVAQLLGRDAGVLCTSIDTATQTWILLSWVRTLIPTSAAR